MARGVRFAPSPTGDFHVGNLRTAWVSHEWARALGEPWIVRFDDIDRPRVLAGARERQLLDMKSLGLAPDLEQTQSEHEEQHWDLFLEARREGLVYPCFCSRKEVHEAILHLASAPHAPTPLYDGHCRGEVSLRASHPFPSIAWRFRSKQEDAGKRDFIVARTNPMADRESFSPAYAWATAIDDFLGDFALLVRARDLAHALVDQREVQEWLRKKLGRFEQKLPAVFHTSLVTMNDGSRLEKRSKGVRLSELTAKGLSIEDVVSTFAGSFILEANEFAPAKVWGEPREAISLQQLGLAHDSV
jgi:glutamyl-tRNA synthetase